jgi:hypothetical protein
MVLHLFANLRMVKAALTGRWVGVGQRSSKLKISSPQVLIFHKLHISTALLVKDSRLSKLLVLITAAFGSIFLRWIETRDGATIAN